MKNTIVSIAVLFACGSGSTVAMAIEQTSTIVSTASCQSGIFSFHLTLTSKPQKLDQWSTMVNVVRSERTLEVVFSSASYFELFRSTKTGVCGDAVAFSLSNGNILIPLAQDNRDWEARLSVFVYDPARNSIVSVAQSIGRIVIHDQPKGILLPADDFRSLANGFYLKEASRCENGGGGPDQFIEGSKIVESRFCTLPLWWRLTAGNGIHQALDETLTYEDSEIKPFFADKELFKNRFHLNELGRLQGTESARFKWRSYWRAILENGRICLKRGTFLTCLPPEHP